MSQLTEDFATIFNVVCVIIMILFHLIYLKGTVRLFQLLPQVYHWKAFLNKDRIDYKKWTRIYKIVFFLTTVIVMLYLALDFDNCEKRRIKNNPLQSCGVFMSYYLPYDFKEFPIRHYILIHQAICVLVGFLVLDHTLFIPIFYIDKTLCLMDYMISLVNDVNNLVEDDNKLEEHLRQITDIHQVIIRFNKWYNSLSRYFHMSLYMSGRFIMALQIFHIIMVGYDEYLINLLIWTFIISLFEIGGQLLINKSMELETVVYKVKWYKINKIKDRRSYHLLYLMSQRAITLEAGPYLHLSLPLLLQTYRATYSFTTMLINMSSQQT